MDELYQSQILHLARAVRASTEIAHPTHHGHVKNTVCGDEIHLHLHLKDDKVTAIHIVVEGCALCEAGAGLWLQLAEGKMADELPHLADDIDAFLKQGNSDEAGPFAALTPILTIKNRHKC